MSIEKQFKNPFIRFISLFAILVVLWFGFYENLYKIDSLFGKSYDLQREISIHLADFSTYFIRLLGYTPTINSNTDYIITNIDGNYLSQGVWIGEPCNGLKVFGLFAIFIIAFKGKWKYKIPFIFIGIILLHLVNAIRIAILTIISAENPTLLDFNHNITFQVLVYGLVFIMWYVWVNKFANKK